MWPNRRSYSAFPSASARRVEASGELTPACSWRDHSPPALSGSPIRGWPAKALRRSSALSLATAASEVASSAASDGYGLLVATASAQRDEEQQRSSARMAASSASALNPANPAPSSIPAMISAAGSRPARIHALVARRAVLISLGAARAGQLCGGCSRKARQGETIFQTAEVT